MRRSVVARGNARVSITTALLLMAVLSACGLLGKTGEGPLTTESRPLTGFTSVNVSNGIGVTVRFGQSSSVDVSAQANILPIIATVVEGETLTIRSTEGFTTSAGVGVTVVMPALSGMSLSGGSVGVVEGFGADRFEITLDGGSVLTATGTATVVNLTASGGSVAKLDALLAETANIQVSGGANVTVQASKEVAGSASGGARVTVLGSATLNVEASGGAAVTRG